MPRPAHVASLLLVTGLVLARPACAADTPVDALARPLPLWHRLVPPADKLQHAGLSFSIAAGIGVAGRAPGIGAGVAIGFGAAKEWHDRRDGGGFDPRDLAADVVGSVLGALAARAITR